MNTVLPHDEEYYVVKDNAQTVKSLIADPNTFNFHSCIHAVFINSLIVSTFNKYTSAIFSN